jgi:hypothetical protein
MAAHELQARINRTASQLDRTASQLDCTASPTLSLYTAVAVHPGVVYTHLSTGFFSSQARAWAEGTPLALLLPGEMSICSASPLALLLPGEMSICSASQVEGAQPSGTTRPW